MDIEITRWRLEDTPLVYRLIEKTFLEHVAPSVSRKGIREFFKSVSPDHLRRDFHKYKGYIAYHAAGQTMVGFVAVDLNCHLSFLFVASDYQEKGIGRRLISTVEDFCQGRSIKKVDVYASMNAIAAYEAYGFIKNGEEREINGLKFQPMMKRLNESRDA